MHYRSPASRIWHPKRELDRLLKECKDGELSRKRSPQMERIRKDVEALKRKHPSFGALKDLAHGIFKQDAETLLGRFLQFSVNAVLGTFVSIAVIRTFFPDLFSHGGAAIPPQGVTQDGLG